MCRPVACRSCGKTTWAGCGQHVDQVMRGIPANDRCKGHDASEAKSAPSPLSRLFGRR